MELLSRFVSLNKFDFGVCGASGRVSRATGPRRPNVSHRITRDEKAKAFPLANAPGLCSLLVCIVEQAARRNARRLKTCRREIQRNTRGFPFRSARVPCTPNRQATQSDVEERKIGVRFFRSARCTGLTGLRDATKIPRLN